MNKTNYLLKNMGILTISNFASKILVFLLVPLYTSVLTTTEYGSYDLAVSTATLLYPILTLNIVDAVMRFSMDKDYSKEKIASIGMRFVSISIVLFGLGMFILNRFSLWPDIHGLEPLVFFYYVSYVFNQFLIQFAKGLERVKDMGVAGVISTVITLATNILFLLVFKWGLVGFFLANILAQALSALYLMTRVRFLKFITDLRIDKELAREMLVYCVPLIATVVGWWINSTADKYVVTFMIGVSANGLLSVSYKIPQIINTLQSIFTQAWQISAIKEYGNEDTSRFYGNTFSIINVLMCAVCSWLILLTKPIASILYSKDFYAAWQYVPFLLIASVLNCASGLLGPILAAKKNSKAMMWSALIGAVANIILNIALVYIIGIQGATIATVICSYIIYVVRKIAVGKDITIERYSTILLTWLLLSAQATVEIYVGKWWIEVFIMIVLLIINAPTLKKLMASMRGVMNSIKCKVKINMK